LTKIVITRIDIATDHPFLEYVNERSSTFQEVHYYLKTSMNGSWILFNSGVIWLRDDMDAMTFKLANQEWIGRMNHHRVSNAFYDTNWSIAAYRSEENSQV
jgi:hypothetical protein